MKNQREKEAIQNLILWHKIKALRDLGVLNLENATLKHYLERNNYTPSDLRDMGISIKNGLVTIKY